MSTYVRPRITVSELSKAIECLMYMAEAQTALALSQETRFSYYSLGMKLTKVRNAAGKGAGNKNREGEATKSIDINDLVETVPSDDDDEKFVESSLGEVLAGRDISSEDSERYFALTGTRL